MSSWQKTGRFQHPFDQLLFDLSVPTASWRRKLICRTVCPTSPGSNSPCHGWWTKSNTTGGHLIYLPCPPMENWQEKNEFREYSNWLDCNLTLMVGRTAMDGLGHRRRSNRQSSRNSPECQSQKRHWDRNRQRMRWNDGVVTIRLTDSSRRKLRHWTWASPSHDNYFSSGLRETRALANKWNLELIPNSRIIKGEKVVSLNFDEIIIAEWLRRFKP